MQAPTLDAVQRAVGDRYEVLGLVDIGGMGAVFRARHRTLGHIVAVKVLPPEVATSEMRRERFRREARLGASLDHPNVVRVYDFDTRNGISYLIMTFVRGDSLEKRLRSAKLTTSQALRIVREIGDALGYAHRRGIVHRDVKPANIMLEEDSGRALLADFGIARVEGTDEPSLTQPDAVIGTPGYMPPEQATGGRVDGRTDLYALGVVAYETLAGDLPPYQSHPSTLARTLRTGRSRLTARVASALVAPLAVPPEDRPATAGAWLERLDAAQRLAWRPWAAAAVVVVSVVGVLRMVTGAHGSCQLGRDEPTRLAVMPFTVLGTAPYPARQLPEYFISRFRPVERLGEVISFGRVAAQIGTEAPSNTDARDLACRLGATFFVQGSVAFAGPTVSLTATLYEGGHARRSGRAAGRVGEEESEIMDRVWTQLYPEFTPNPDVTLPNGGPEALASYLNAEAAFRRGDYRTARDEYTRVIRADTDFAIGRLRLALVAAHVYPTEQGLYVGSALRGAEHHQRGLSIADSLLLDGFKLLVADGDGLAALDRFKRATEQAPGYEQAWYVLGEFYIHFGTLFDQSVSEAAVAFNRVLEIEPRFTPAIAHLIALAHQTGDRRETADLIHRYLRIDSTSAVAEAVGIFDTLLLGTAPDQLALLRNVCRHSFFVLEDLSLQAAAFGTRTQREGPGRVVLRCLERRGATDAERALALRMGVAADLAAGWPDSARQRLARATGPWAARERDLWVLVAHATRVATLGDAIVAANRVSARIRGGLDTDAVAHWVLARVGVDPSRHAAALARLAGPIPASLAADLQAQNALQRGDTTRALRLWDGATRRYAVMSVPLELVASLWPLRLDMARVAVARKDTAVVARACETFETLMGDVDQVAQPEVERLCRTPRG
jgi:tetratricopeptide (TPR) repeat protein